MLRVIYKPFIGAVAAVTLFVAATWSLPVARAGENFGAGLSGWWLLDEGGGTLAADSSGVGNHGSLVGAVAFTPNAVLGSALDFTGPNGGVIVAHSPSLEPVKGTIEAWVKVAQLHNADIVMKTTDLLVRTHISGGFSVYGLRITHDGRAVGFIANDDPTTPGAPWRSAVSPPNLLIPGQWHHLAMRWDGSTVDIFVDGALQGATAYDPVPGTGLSYHGASKFGLGVATAGGGEFIGQLDDVRFYGRARRQVEILTDYVTKGHQPAKPPAF